MGATASEYIPLVSIGLSALSLVLALFAFRRTSRFQDVDYRPHLSFGPATLSMAVDVDRDADDDEEERLLNVLELVCQGTITNVGPKPVTLLMGRVLLGPQHRDDPEHALTVPVHRTLGTGNSCDFEFALRWGTIWSVSKHFNRTKIECHLKLGVRGADGVTREIDRYLIDIMQTEGSRWCAIVPSDFVEILQEIQQSRLRQRIDPAPTPAERRSRTKDVDAPF